MTISVVIPAYNEEKYLPLTLESISRLERKPDEILVIDGKSTDKTAEVARSLGARVEIVAHRGIGYARQQGLLLAKSDIVAYTDADTTVPANWLTIIETTLTKPDTVGVLGTYMVIDGWFPYRLFINVLMPIFWKLLFLFGIPMAAGQNIAFKKAAGLKAGGFPENYKIAEDVEMARRLMAVGKVVFNHKLKVKSSGRRGNEGLSMIPRVIKAFFYYFKDRKADTIGFPDMR